MYSHVAVGYIIQRINHNSEYVYISSKAIVWLKPPTPHSQNPAYIRPCAYNFMGRNRISMKAASHSYQSHPHIQGKVSIRWSFAVSSINNNVGQHSRTPYPERPESRYMWTELLSFVQKSLA